MELYATYDDMRPRYLIDEFESLIWRERYSGHGDFELVVKEEYFLTSSLKYYTFLRFNESGSVMMIETVDIRREQTDDDGTGAGNMVVLTGRSLEAFLKYRQNTDFGDQPLAYSDTIPNIAKRLMESYVINHPNAEVHIPNLQIGYIWQGSDVVGRMIKRGVLYDVIKNLLDARDYGWGIKISGDSDLTFTVYRGFDNTNRYSTFYREFSEETETMTNMSYIQSIATWYNHAIVHGARSTVDVYLGDGPHSAFNRRTLVVRASDVGTDEEQTIAQDNVELRRQGLDALNAPANRYISAIDGEVPYIEWSKMSYGLGDLVRVKDYYAKKAKMRIIEDTWTINREGVKRIPSFREVPEDTFA